MNAKAPVIMDSGLACIILLAQFYEKPTNLNHLQHELAAEIFSTETILHAFNILSLKAKAIQNVTWERLQQLTLPAIAERLDGSFVVLAKVA